MAKNPADSVQQWPIERLAPYARNARTHSDEQIDQLVASIKEWGWTVPVLVDPAGVIIAGHGRVLAARKLGMASVPVMAEGWTDAQMRAYVIADNRIPQAAGWDEALLRMELDDLKAIGFDVKLTGFEDDELAVAMGKASGVSSVDVHELHDRFWISLRGPLKLL